MKTYNQYPNLFTQAYDLKYVSPPNDEYAFYRSYVVNSKLPVLEPMCGSGCFLLPLYEEGFDVHGFDASKSMLNALDMKIKPGNARPDVWYSFIQDWSQSIKYGLIFIPNFSFGHVYNLDDVISSLKKFHAHLDDNGSLVFGIVTFKDVRPKPGNWDVCVYEISAGKILIESFLCYELKDNIESAIYKHELVEENQIVQTEIMPWKFRIYEPQQMINTQRCWI